MRPGIDAMRLDGHRTNPANCCLERRSRMERGQILLRVCSARHVSPRQRRALLELRDIKPPARDSVTDFLEDAVEKHYGECAATE
jgi:hypothetical protein